MNLIKKTFILALALTVGIIPSVIAVQNQDSCSEEIMQSCSCCCAVDTGKDRGDSSFDGRCCCEFKTSEPVKEALYEASFNFENKIEINVIVNIDNNFEINEYQAENYLSSMVLPDVHAPPLYLIYSSFLI